MRMWIFSKGWLHDIRDAAILVVVAMLGTALEPALKVASWRMFGDCFLETQLCKALRVAGISDDVVYWISDTIIYTAPTLAICVALYACLRSISGDGRRVTRCRRCRHVLRKLSEPRCPECGEPI